ECSGQATSRRDKAGRKTCSGTKICDDASHSPQGKSGASKQPPWLNSGGGVVPIVVVRLVAGPREADFLRDDARGCRAAGGNRLDAHRGVIAGPDVVEGKAHAAVGDAGRRTDHHPEIGTAGPEALAAGELML